MIAMDVKKGLKTFIRSEGLYNFCHNPFALIGFFIVLLFFVTSLFGPNLVTQNPYDL